MCYLLRKVVLFSGILTTRKTLGAGIDGIHERAIRFYKG